MDSAKVMASSTGSPSSGAPDGEMRRLVSEIRELAQDHLELATLETRLSVVTVVRMAVVAVFTALVLVSAWLAALGAAALGLVSLGVAPVFAMLLVAAVNLVVAFIGWLRIKRLSHWIGWGATQRAIKSAPAGEPQRAAA